MGKEPWAKKLRERTLGKGTWANIIDIEPLGINKWAKYHLQKNQWQKIY